MDDKKVRNCGLLLYGPPALCTCGECDAELIACLPKYTKLLAAAKAMVYAWTGYGNTREANAIRVLRDLIAELETD